MNKSKLTAAVSIESFLKGQQSTERLIDSWLYIDGDGDSKTKQGDVNTSPDAIFKK